MRLSIEQRLERNSFPSLKVKTSLTSLWRRLMTEVKTVHAGREQVPASDTTSKEDRQLDDDVDIVQDDGALPPGTVAQIQSASRRSDIDPLAEPPDGGLNAWLKVFGCFLLYSNIWCAATGDAASVSCSASALFFLTPFFSSGASR